MKNKLNIRGRLLGAVAIVAASFIGATTITAFAGGPDCTCEHKCTADKIDPDCELCKYDYTMCEGEDPVETEPEEPTEPEEEKWGPLTPDGNMTLVDDYGSLEAGGKYDMSDAVGIIKSENITRELIEKAVVNFYESFENLSHPEEARKLLDSIFSADNLEELYDSTRSSESDNRVILKDIDDNYPKLLNEGNLASVLEAAKRKRVRESKE